MTAIVPASAGSASPRTRAVAPPELFVSPSGSDGSSCTRSAPCSSFDRAYEVARPGTIVRIAAGTYPDQHIEAHGSRARPRVVFVPAPRAAVTVGQLKVSATHLEVRNLAARELEVPRDADDVVFRNIRNHGVWMQGPSNIFVIGGEVTCGTCDSHSHIDDGGPPDFRPPRNIVFDHVYFHDWQAASPDQHTECLQILAGDGITIRNSTFKDCATANNGAGATADLHISWLGNGPKTRNITIENNFFYPSGNTYAIQTNDWANLQFRYNSISGPIIVFGGYGDGTPVVLVGNVMAFSGCSVQGNGGGGPTAALVFRYNVLAGGTCGSTDLNAPSGFVNAQSNLHLRRGAAALNRGDPKLHPTRDIDGQRRPSGRAPDAGADESP